MHKLLATLFLGANVLLTCFGQDFSIHLKSGVIVPPPEIQVKSEPGVQTFEGRNYLLIQFFQPPSPSERAALSRTGIHLLGYLPERTWLASAQLGTGFENPNIRAVVALKPTDKVDPGLLAGEMPMACYRTGGIVVRAFPYPDIELADFAAALSKANFQIEQWDKRCLQVLIPPESLLRLAAHPALMFLESLPETPTAEGWKARSLMRVNQVQGDPGIGYDGADVDLAIADDGAVNHVDFRNRLMDFTTINAGTHGDMTAGIAIGAGNIDPLAKGVAPGATLHLFDIGQYQHILNAPAHYDSDRIVITSTSYGEGCGAIYNYSAQSIDEQVANFPVLFHCFSAGNSGLNSCNAIYGSLEGPDGARYGNITGGRKAAKNTIAVGNLYFDDELRSTSSRGPTNDGRIKPDLCSQGQGNLSTNANNTYQLGGGTSAASPGIAGAAALLYQVYRENQGGDDPPSGLIKAALLNTAEDLGRPGPDYDYGWGRANVSRAVEVIKNGQFSSGAVSTGLQDFHVITVPANTAEVRVMVYWTDPAPSTLAGRALVNDLDITLQSGSGQIYHPLVLSHTPDLDSLLQPAYRGIDRTNNMEEVVWENPASGNYTLRVQGYLVPEGPQEYQVVYSFISNDLQITYPYEGLGIVPGETNLIRWEAPNDYGNFSLQYSLDNKATWHNLANSVASDLRLFEWYVPNTVSEEVFVRVNRGSATAYSDKFTIVGLPDIEFSYVDNHAAAMSWAPVAGATHYEVFALGNQYMEIIGNTTGNNFTFPIEVWEKNWYSIRACVGSGKGRRVFAQEYLHRPCQTQVELDLQFDLYPGEISWEIRSNGGEVVASGGDYEDLPGGTFLTEQSCFPNGCYQLIMYDSYGDGMCCNNGDGYYNLKNGDGNILISGGQFTNSISHDFCLSGSGSNLMLEVVSTTSPSCVGAQDGAALVAAINGSGNYTYHWSNESNGPQVFNLSAGTYQVTVTDGQNQLVGSIQINDPSPLSVDLEVNQPVCNNGMNTTIASQVQGGTPPYTYLWDTGNANPDLETQSAGTYTLSITDAHGCIATQTVTVSTSNPLGLNTAKIDASCHGALNGVAIVAPAGGVAPYTYTWSTGATAPATFGLSAGTYTVTVEDNAGCWSEASIEIEEPASLHLEAVMHLPSCAGVADGSVEAFAEGGTPPYSFQWNNEATTPYVDGLAAGNYQLTLMDSRGCLHTYSGWLPDPVALQIQFNIDDDEVDTQVTGGVPPYTYHWSNGATTGDLQGLGEGQYQLTVTDNHACNIVGTIEIEGAADFCEIRGSNTSFEWIESVSLGEQTYQSGNNGGLGQFLDYHFTANAGGEYELVLQPYFNGTPFGEYWKVWVDWNQDGDFSDDGENIVAAGPTGDPVIRSIEVPTSATLGTTRLRIAMKYGSMPPDCGIYGYGEAEEYSLDILHPTDPLPGAELNRGGNSELGQLLSAQQLTAFPNPADREVMLQLPEIDNQALRRLEVMDVKGQLMHYQVIDGMENTSTLKLVTDDWPVGLYEVRLTDEKEVYTARLVIQR
ncbi:MAG: hypothetical protein DHS20C18_50080 [Saprospiraceae bacterium]|nr:MAG: hypothetical protein DHS20C18_50080 [Saprospiraceae bacterium]